MTNNDLLSESLIDLSQDFIELNYLYTDAKNKLKTFLKQILKQQNNLDKTVYQNAFETACKLLDNLDSLITDLSHNQEKLKKCQTSLELEKLEFNKQQFYKSLRFKLAIISGLLISTDWQSPSFLQSSGSEAGIQTGQITHSLNDYKRDTHLDEKDFEKQFLNEYIKPGQSFNVNTYAVSSGMSAFATILTFLQTEQKIKGPVIIGKNIYFQNKELVQKIFSTNTIVVDEKNTKHIIEIMDKNHSSVIIFDSLSNSIELAKPDLTFIINHLVKTTKNDTYLVIDNTCLSVFFQPLKLLKGKNKKLHLLLFESLNKYYQFGLDRVTGGIIVAYGKDTGKLFYTRENVGSNITDYAVHALPRPNNNLLQKRLIRFERNKNILVNNINVFLVQNPKTKVDKLLVPQTSSKDFNGSFFVITFKEKFSKVSIYQKFIKLIVQEAKKHQVPIISGTSFGLNTTRVYLTSLRSDFGVPFVRVSMGTENKYQIEKLTKVFINVIEKL